MKIPAAAIECPFCYERFDIKSAPPVPETVKTEPNDDVLEGEEAIQYAITTFIKEVPLDRKYLAFYPNITKEVLTKCAFPLEKGEVPLVAVTQPCWLGKKSGTALLITNRKIHYRVINFYLMDIFSKKTTGSFRFEEILKLDFDYAYFNRKGWYFGSPFYVNGNRVGMIFIVEFTWHIFPTFDDKIIDWFQTLFAYLAELQLIQYAPSEAESNASSIFKDLIGSVIEHWVS